jgi:hypothetical protein
MYYYYMGTSSTDFFQLVSIYISGKAVQCSNTTTANLLGLCITLCLSLIPRGQPKEVLLARVSNLSELPKDNVLSHEVSILGS